MRTDREQIEKMAQAMCGFCTEDKRCVLKYSAPCSEAADQDCTYKESAEELICKGYGDISKYKAEIKRLKEVIEVFKNDTECNLNHITVENGQLKAENKVLKDGIVKAFTNGFNEGRKQVEKDIRRAKINTMNELKEKIVEHMGNREYMGVKYKQGVFSESEIDEMIEELKSNDERRD